MCCLLSFKPALKAARQEEQMKILSLIYGADVKHARWARDFFFSPLFLRISILQNTGLFTCSISFTSWWQWKTVKIDALIKGTRGNGEKKKKSSAASGSRQKKKSGSRCSRLSKSKLAGEARCAASPLRARCSKSPEVNRRSSHAGLRALSSRYQCLKAL